MSRPGTPADLAGVDLTDLDAFADGFPHPLFARHREAAPVWWHEPTGHTPDGEGFWSVATYPLVRSVLVDQRTYSSVTGGDRPYGGTLIQDLPVAGMVLNMMDDPRHAEVRRTIAAAMTPAMMRGIEDDVRRRACDLLDGLEPERPVELVSELAGEVPTQVICALLGMPEEDRHWAFEAIEPGFDLRGDVSSHDPDAYSAEAMARLGDYGSQLIAAKRARPTDDLLSTVVAATDDVGEPVLDDGELYLFFVLLFTAGAETTRNAIAGGLAELSRHPDQWAALRADPAGLPAAVEEVVRWTSPSPSERRTATTVTELGGQRIEAGDKVVIWEGSANRDPTAFDRPDRFDTARDPNPHLGFGFGAHHCLGAHLARTEMRVVFGEMLERFSGAEVVDVEWTRSNRHTGYRQMVVRLHR